MFAATLDETSFEKATTDPRGFEASCKALAAAEAEAEGVCGGDCVCQ